MDLKKIHPTDILLSPERGIQEIMRSFLMRANFVPGVRHVMGWRGLKDASSDVFGWTSKIKDFSGIFGMYFNEFEMEDGWIRGRFFVNYFPDPDEELVELFSFYAGVCTQKDDYLLRVRDFLSYPELLEFFSIGIIDLGVHQSADALIFGLESISKQRVIAQNGIFLPQGDRMVEIVKAGDYDQNFPSYSTAMGFYRALAASITFNLEEPPVYLEYMSQPGMEIIYDASGNNWENPSYDAQKEYLYLGYGKANFENTLIRMAKKEASSTMKLIWEKGDAMISNYKNELWWTAHNISDYKTLDKKILGIDDRAQLIILTGFLGSGKTSFLQHFIEYQVQHNRFVAIVQNEIGDIGLDGRLLDHEYSVTEIDEGCVCCTLIGSLKRAIHQILSTFQPDYIVLETTGLANPYNLLDEISEVDELVRFDSITTVVDGINFYNSLNKSDVVRNQISAADILLLNKKDLLTEKEIKKIQQELRKINPSAPILSTKQGDINPALIYGVDPQDIKMTPQEQCDEKANHIHHSHEHYGFSSHRISFTRPLDKELFINKIKSLSPTVFRIKGVLDFVDSETSLLFQYVGGRFEFSEFNNPNMTDRFLILIGQNIQKESIEAVFSD